MKMNQKGITLVELIVVLALVSVITAIAWTALVIGFKHTVIETSKTQLQQEANLVITKITNEHQRNDFYYLAMNAGQLEINKCNENEAAVVVCDGFTSLMENNYTYTGSIDGESFISWDSTKLIDPKRKHIKFILEVSDPFHSADPAKPARSVRVETTLTRILTDQN